MRSDELRHSLPNGMKRTIRITDKTELDVNFGLQTGSVSVLKRLFSDRFGSYV